MALQLLIFVRPFICSPVSQKINIVYLILLLTVLFLWICSRGISYINYIIIFSFLLLIAILAISVLVSVNKIIAIEKLLLYGSGFALILAAQSLSYKEKNNIIICLIITGLVVCCCALYQYFYLFPKILNYTDISTATLDYINQKRVNYPLFTPNALGGFLIMIIPMALTMNKPYGITIPLIVVLLLTQSIGALCSFLIASIIYYCTLKQLRRKELMLLAGFTIAILIIILIRASTGNQNFQPFYSSSMRLSYWHDTFQIIKAHPWRGIGLGDFDLNNSRYSHNAYLQIWAETGIFGLAAFLSIIICVLKTGFETVRTTPDKIKTAALLCSACAFLIHNVIDFTFFLPEVSICWFVILGLLMNKASPARS